jgi:hypothetical protein
MRRLPLVLFLIALAAPASAGETLQAETKAWTVDRGSRLRFSFPVGSLRVEATDDSKVRLELLVKCRWTGSEKCRKVADRLTLDVDQSSNELSVEVDGYPKFGNSGINLHAVLQVPRSLDVKLEMGVGELEVEGLAGHLQVDLGVGEADLTLDESGYRSADVEVGVGDASLRASGRRQSSSGFVGRAVRWDDGTGTSKARLHVGVGDARVRMN